MNRVTASGSGRILQCSGHVRLPWVRESSAAADEGTRLHAIMDGEGLDATAYRDRVEGEPQTIAAWEAWEAWAPAAATLGRKHHERAGIVDTETRTARWLPPAAHRDYGAIKWHEVAGTADLIVEAPDAIFVIDWKFGREAVDASESAQLRTLAAIAALNPEYAHLDRFHAIIVQAPAGGRADPDQRQSRDHEQRECDMNDQYQICKQQIQAKCLRGALFSCCRRRPGGGGH
jgi:hypothetical protein